MQYRFITILFTIVLFSCQSQEKELPFYNTPDFTPIFLNNEKDIDRKITHEINDFSFLDQHNQQITQKDIEGKIHVANFIFTSCGSICPVMTNHMKIIDQEFSDDQEVAILSYSVTPWIDNVEVLQEYTEKQQIQSKNWHFLTGDKSEIYQLARQSYFAEEDLGFTKDSTDFLHTEHVILVDADKRIRGIYNGTIKLDMRQLAKDIEALKAEKKKNIFG
ncbi:SCO family protein [Flammeovirga agarivorans]|uniref:SCO family protein n=1 Tax=Flammeovirga agarivorans TaxID=2726742 RepID=A0A7X8SKZ9_9BACT|nr:SCO family protein [Flammeovirga agarivorans]NLR92158.1 SCO family protein [Flammeovirga agarivorans]